MVLERLLAELGRSTRVEVNRQTWSKFESDLREFFTEGKILERYEKLKNEEWEVYDDEPFECEDCYVIPEDKEHYASLSLDFSLFGWDLVLTPETLIQYAVLPQNDAFYLGIQRGFKGQQEIYVRY